VLDGQDMFSSLQTFNCSEGNKVVDLIDVEIWGEAEVELWDAQ